MFNNLKKKVNNIGRVLVIEFDDKDSLIFDEIMRSLERNPAFAKLKLKDETLLSLPGLEIHPQSRKIYRDRREIHLTTKEFDLLTFLAEHPNHVFTKDELFKEIWDMDSIGDIATVTVHIKKIREKIEYDTSKPQYIETIWGVGYRFKV